MAGALIGAGIGSLTHHVARRIKPSPVDEGGAVGGPGENE
jgi:hypothetical protein